MKIVFMGTPNFAVGALEALIAAGHEITAVVTQPDKARGRGGQTQFPPVKECALRHGIPVFQPRRIKTPEAVEELRHIPADIFVVAAFGQILFADILAMPGWGCLNIHASLLPKYRGASPIQHVLLAGEEKTGITIMQMNEGLDTGDILYQKEVAIAPKDTAQTLHDKLMLLGGEAIVEALPLLEAGKLIPRPQEDGKSCYAPLIRKEMGRIDFAESAEAIERKIRAMASWPSAYTYYRGKQLKIWEADVMEETVDAGAEMPSGAVTGSVRPDQEAGAVTGSARPDEEGNAERVVPSDSCGRVLAVTRDALVVGTGRGALRITNLQLEGKKRMSAHDFLLGMKILPGEQLSEG